MYKLGSSSDAVADLEEQTLATADARGRGDIPIVFCCLNQVINLGVDELENALLCRLLAGAELLGCLERDWTARRRRGTRFEQKNR